MLAFFSLYNLHNEHLPAFIARMRMLTSKLFTCPAKTGIQQSHVRVSFPAFCLRGPKRGKAVSRSHLLQIRTTCSPSDPKSSGGPEFPPQAGSWSLSPGGLGAPQDPQARGWRLRNREDRPLSSGQHLGIRHCAVFLYMDEAGIMTPNPSSHALLTTYKDHISPHPPFPEWALKCCFWEILIRVIGGWGREGCCREICLGNWVTP